MAKIGPSITLKTPERISEFFFHKKSRSKERLTMKTKKVF
jgi:hypothetical protein